MKSINDEHLEIFESLVMLATIIDFFRVEDKEGVLYTTPNKLSKN